MHATYHQLKEIKGDRHFLMRDEKGVLLLLLSIFQRRRKTSPTTNGAHKFCCFCVVRVCACACVCVCVCEFDAFACSLSSKKRRRRKPHLSPLAAADDSTLKWVDGKKALFRLRALLVSSIYSQDESVARVLNSKPHMTHVHNMQIFTLLFCHAFYSIPFFLYLFFMHRSLYLSSFLYTHYFCVYFADMYLFCEFYLNVNQTTI